MDLISGKWLLFLGCAAAWSTVFSLFNPPVRGWRNLGVLAGYVLGLAMAFALPWRMALTTWATAGVASGLLYFAYEGLAYARAVDRTRAVRPSPAALLHGLLAWPVMLPEAIEYLLADLGILKAPPAPGAGH